MKSAGVSRFALFSIGITLSGGDMTTTVDG